MTEDTSALIKDARTRAHNVLTNGAIGDLLLKLANALQASLAADVVVARFTDEAMQIARSQAIEETREAIEGARNDIAIATLEVIQESRAGRDWPHGTGGEIARRVTDVIRRALSPPPAVSGRTE